MLKRVRVSPLVLSAALLAAALVGACGQQSKPAETPAGQSQSSAAETKRFHLEGKIVAIKADTNALSIDAKEIPGFMGAMTMDYSVQSKDSLQGLSVGDEITADVVVPGSGASYIENIKVTKKAGA